MSGKLILSGGGDENDSQNTDSYFVNLLRDGAKILYIPHANLKQSNNYAPSLEWLDRTLQSIDRRKRLNIIIPSDLSDLNDLESYDAIYIGGGNTFHLMKLIRESRLDIQLLNYYESGGLIYGGSAGAIILGKTINTVKSENKINSKYSDGLDLLCGLSVLCHYDNVARDTLFDDNLGVVLCLYESTGVLINNGQVANIGIIPFELNFKVK